MTDDELPRTEWVPGQLALPLPSRPRLLSLFSGYGGLDMAVAGLLGADVVAHCEHEPPTKNNPNPTQAAARLLAYRFPDVPNLGDVSRVDWADVADTLGPVDVITGGFPCQDVSLAGRRLGIAHDTRSGLWAHMAAAVDVLRPSLVVIENVRGLLSARANHPAHSDVVPCPWCLGRPDEVSLRALGAVVGDLSDLGYDAAWTLVRAADVGAPHARARVFVVAGPGDPDSVAREAVGAQHRGPGAVGEPGTVERAFGSDRVPAADPDGDAVREQPITVAGRCGPPLAGLSRADAAADPAGSGREGSDSAGRLPRPSPHPGVRIAAGRGAAAADPDGDGREVVERVERRLGARGHADGRGADDSRVDWGAYGPAVARWAAVLGRPAPPPAEPGAKGGQRLSPRFVEWMMGLPDGWVTAVPGISRNDALKLLGNGVVPQQAAAAVASLLDAISGAEQVA